MEWTAENWPIASAMIWAGSRHDAGPDAWLADLSRVRRAGFTELDPTDTWIRIADLDASGRRAFADAVGEAGLGIPALSTSRRSPIDPLHGDENLAYLHRVIDAAAELAIPLVSVGLFEPLNAAQRDALWFWTAQGPVNEPEQRPYAVARLRELAEHGEDAGVLLSLEMYEDTFLGTADSAVRLVQEIGHPGVGLNPDVANLVRLHRPVEHWRSMLEKVLPLSNYWHAKNYSRTEDATTGVISTAPAPMLGGIIDYRWAIDYAIASGFRGAFCLEQYGGDALGICAENRRYVRGLLDELVPGGRV